MKPKIAYLIDETYDCNDKPSWKFYTEEEVPEYMLRSKNVRRIVYWEIDDV